MRISLKQRFAIACGLAASVSATGCHFNRAARFEDCTHRCGPAFQQIEYPDVCPDKCGANMEGDHLRTGAPLTVRNWEEQESWPLTLEEAIEMALAGNKVFHKLGGRVISGPQGTATAFDPAIVETDPFLSSEAALSAFDAQFTGVARLDHSERKFNNLFFGAGAVSQNSNRGNLRAGLSKYAANGSQFNVFSASDYSSNNSPGNRFPSAWDTILQAEVRQPLARGAGTDVNRIAGPNASPGAYNGVLIARIRGDVALADFEAAVRDLTRDVEMAYWELYFYYRDLDVKKKARESSLLTWEYTKRRLDSGLSRPDDEALSRQQYFVYEQQLDDALSGNASGQTGVLGAERQLRRLLGLVNNDGRLIRPSTEPTIAPVLFDWEQSQEQALIQRVELRRQKWILRQRELELYAARKLNKWQVDLVGNYGARGFGDELTGNRGTPEGSAFSDMLTGQLDDWGLGIEVQGPVGNRVGHLAIRNAELQLTREKALLEEQQKQLLLDLNAAYAEVDRSFAAIRNSYNARVAVEAELEPKRQRAEKGEEDVFFLLDAQRRATNIETVFHRSVVNYNLALQNFIYTSGGLLQHYNIRLVEGQWEPAAVINAANKERKYQYGSVAPELMDICPISEGAVDQETDVIILPQIDSGTGSAPTKEPTSSFLPDLSARSKAR